MVDRTANIRDALHPHKDVCPIFLRIEDAFSRDWWNQVTGTSEISSVAIQLANEGMLHYIPRA